MDYLSVRQAPNLVVVQVYLRGREGKKASRHTRHLFPISKHTSNSEGGPHNILPGYKSTENQFISEAFFKKSCIVPPPVSKDFNVPRQIRLPTFPLNRAHDVCTETGFFFYNSPSSYEKKVFFLSVFSGPIKPTFFTDRGVALASDVDTLLWGGFWWRLWRQTTLEGTFFLLNGPQDLSRRRSKNFFHINWHDNSYRLCNRWRFNWFFITQCP